MAASTGYCTAETRIGRRTPYRRPVRTRAPIGDEGPTCWIVSIGARPGRWRSWCYCRPVGRRSLHSSVQKGASMDRFPRSMKRKARPRGEWEPSDPFFHLSPAACCWWPQAAGLLGSSRALEKKNHYLCLFFVVVVYK